MPKVKHINAMDGSDEAEQESQSGHKPAKNAKGTKSSRDDMEQSSEANEDAEGSLEEEIRQLKEENAYLRKNHKKTKGWFNRLKSSLMNEEEAEEDEEDDEEPETNTKTDKIVEELQNRVHALEEEKAMATLTKHLGIPKEHKDYFAFLLSQRSAQLDEGEELDDDDYDYIYEKMKHLIGQPNQAKAQAEPEPEQDQEPDQEPVENTNSTGKRMIRNKQGVGLKSVNSIDLSTFKKMGNGERMNLAKKRPDLYNALVNEDWKKDGFRTVE